MLRMADLPPGVIQPMTTMPIESGPSPCDAFREVQRHHHRNDSGMLRHHNLHVQSPGLTALGKEANLLKNSNMASGTEGGTEQNSSILSYSVVFGHT